MTYKIYNFVDNWTKEFNDWWELIAYFDGDTSNIAHNENDVYVYCREKFSRKPNNLTYDEEIVEKVKKLLIGESTYFPPPERYVQRRCLVVFDEYKMINLAEIKEAIKVYKPRNKKYHSSYYRGRYFVYRYDPVPFTGCGRWYSGWYRRIPRNKSYYAKLSEYVDLFPNDASIRRAANFVSKWSDDFPPRCVEKSWKSQSKKKKQWM